MFTTKFSPQGVHLELEGWPWKGEGEKVRWEPKGCVEAQRLGVSNPGKVKLNANFEKNTMKIMLGQD